MNRTADEREPGWGQSLAYGAAGIALLAIERARTSRAGWAPVQRLARQMTSEPLATHPGEATLFHGAPAVAFALHATGHPGYAAALAKIDNHVATLTRIRLAQANRRIDHGELPRASEYDLINGLTGFGALHLYQGNHDLLEDVLRYLVRLNHPIRIGGENLPGWWSAGSPDRYRSERWNRGHAGFGMAHGIAGPLALLSIAMRRAITVAGQHDAMHAICAWLDQWRGENGQHGWWPEVIDRGEHESASSRTSGPHRPSWCYGTPGIARAQHHAGLALHDTARIHAAESAMIGCLTDAAQLELLTDGGLCHGRAGLVHTAQRAAADSSNIDLIHAVTAATEDLRTELAPMGSEGFLEGGAGLALTIDASIDGREPLSGWDACLLI